MHYDAKRSRSEPEFGGNKDESSLTGANQTIFSFRERIYTVTVRRIGLCSAPDETESAETSLPQLFETQRLHGNSRDLEYGFTRVGQLAHGAEKAVYVREEVEPCPTCQAVVCDLCIVDKFCSV